MSTILKPCSVPWSISPSGGGLTLTHTQDDEPECSVVFNGWRANEKHDRRIELDFILPHYYIRTGYHSDRENIEAIGYKIDDGYDGPPNEHHNWIMNHWETKGICLNSGFYYAIESDWLDSLKLSDGFRHYVVDDRDGYVELIAQSFTWKEWIWMAGHRDDVVKTSEAINTGKGPM